MSDPAYERTLAVGVVQTTLDAGRAWVEGAKSPKMSDAEDEHAWQPRTW